MKKRILSFLLMCVILLSSLSAYANNKLTFNIVNLKDSSNIEIMIQGERERKAILVIKDSRKTHFMDEISLDENGRAKVKVELEKDRKYDISLSSDGDFVLKENFEIRNDKTDPGEVEIPDNKNVSLRIEGYSGTILNQSNIAVEMGESIMDLTKRILDSRGIKYKEKNGYMISIDGQAEFDKGSGSGWMFTINGKFPNKSADDLRARDYKRIEWKYTYDFGNDIGASKNWLKIDDKFDNKVDKILKDLEEKDIKEKDVLNHLKELSKEVDKISSDKRLNYGEKIYDSLYLIQNKFKSNDVSSKVGEITLKLVKLISKDIENKERTMELFSRNLGLVNLSLENIKSEKEREDLAKDLIKLAANTNKEIKNPNKNSKSLVKINFAKEEAISLNKELLAELKNNQVNKLVIENENLSVELSLRDLEAGANLELSKDYIAIKDGEKRDIKLTPPIKIRVKSSSKDKLIKINGETIGGLNKGKETVAYGNSLGEIELKDRKKVNFEDLGNYSWAKEAVEILGGNEVVAGRNEMKFDPKANITRAEFSALVARLLNLEPGSKDLNFKDVDSNAWYYASVKALSEKGYINGRTSEKFDPNGKITREEMSKILGEILKDYDYKQVATDELSKFTDNSQVSSWAKEGAVIVVKNEALKGSDGKFNPKANATRAETVTMLYRTYKLILED